jgi:4-amino-4-deoxy-L-arabinose transferase-like glycosyltransferase
MMLLIGIALPGRLYLVRHTEVAARDSIGYIRYARQLGNEPYIHVLRATEQPPLYALTILAISAPVRHFAVGPESAVMQLSAQLASVLAGVLLIFPTVLMGRELFDRRVAFWAALLFQCLPATGRFLSDGLSEATFLLFAATSLWLGVRGLRAQSVISFALAGMCGGLAYLTRPEGGLVVAAIGLVLVGCQLNRGWRFPARRFAECALCLAMGAVLVAGPYIAVIGRLTNKQSHRSIFENRVVSDSPRITVGSPVAVWWPGKIDEAKGTWGLQALGIELSRGAFHVGWLAALIGIWACRERLRTTPGLWVLLLLCALMCVLLWRLGNVMGYLSDRHCLLILFCAMYWIAAGFRTTGDWLARQIQPYVGEWTAKKGLWRQLIEERLTSGRAVATILLLILIGVALPKSLERLHGNRAGLRQVGLWLREHSDPSDPIVDPYCWSHYYADRVFLEGLATDPPPGHTPVRYVVIEHGKSDHVRLTGLEDARKLAEKGREVYRWSGKQGKQPAEVVVYEVAAH